MKRVGSDANAQEKQPAGGLAVWLLDRLRRRPQAQPRLALLERIALAPRQSLALVEAEGRRLLVATSAEGAPTFYALDRSSGCASLPQTTRRSRSANAGRRISW